MAKKKLKVGIYCRVSSENQKDNTSLQSQRELGIKFCNDRGFDYEVFEEVVSGVKVGDERVEFLKLEERIFDGDIGGIWIYDWDRMIRDLDVTIYFRNLVEDSGVRVFVGFEEKNILEGSGELEYGLSSVFSEYWKRKVVRIMREGRNKRWKEGKGLGKIGFGFGSEEGVITYIKEELEVVKDIYKFFLYKNCRKYGDCERMIIKKYGREVNGKRLDGGLVIRVLGNKKYNGELIFNTKKDGVFKFDLDKVVDDETFNAVLEKLKFVKGVRIANQKETYLLKGRVFCNDCGKSMWIEGSGKMVGGKSYRYYKCSNHKENIKRKNKGVELIEKCSSGNRGNKISKDKLDLIVWNGLFRLLIQSDDIIKEYKRRYNSESGVKDKHIGKKGYYDRELKKLTDRKNKIMNLYLDGDISESDYKDWISGEYDANKRKIESKILGIKGEIAKYGYVDKIDSWMSLMKEEILKQYHTERIEDKLSIINQYVERVFVKEIINPKNKVFEVGLKVNIGKMNEEFEFQLNKKSLSMSENDRHFYILKSDFVEGKNLIYKKHITINLSIKVKYNICGREDLEFSKNIIQIIDFQ